MSSSFSAIVADLERAYQMRLQPVSLPDAPDARGADAQLVSACSNAWPGAGVLASSLERTDVSTHNE